MTVRRLAAILFIFVSTALAWFALGSSVLVRSGSTDSTLGAEVTRLWGGPHAQVAPRAFFTVPVRLSEVVTESDASGGEIRRTVERIRHEEVAIPLSRSRVMTDLALEHRKKGLFWYDTYTLGFHGTYDLRIPEQATGPITVAYRFPTADAIYDDFLFRVDGRDTPEVGNLSDGIANTFSAQPGTDVTVEIGYRSRGLDTWRYLFVPQGVTTVRDFELVMTTDFDEVDFPAGALSPTSMTRTADGRRLVWSFDNLVSGKSIGMDLPNRLNPGPLTARITFFAPVALLFFVTVLVVLDVLGHLRLHPAHYFFLSAAFFAFHLLLAYLVDHVDVHLAFGLASLASIGLVLSYLRLVCGLRRALRTAGASQLVFLVLFSYAFFFEGYTGLTVTTGAVITLFVLMQLTGRVDWDGVFASRREISATGASPG